ncbi:hypothetical protein [Streptomyces iconiensis]|uniref:Uncharacterized protein n=1 Tax=Streptomyces iconiensis TaxID=1384038 RepID=A0ABT6ZQH8_9ACTN|nr:hypothetical protein [Streptomyces iconiensis]MDJ1131310.1 hypothetical protein [Streptomyces iconiensis]
MAERQMQVGEGSATGAGREHLRGRLDSYRKVADARCETLRAQLLAAEDFAATLRRRLRNTEHPRV